MNAEEIIRAANFEQARALFRGSGSEHDLTIEWSGQEAAVRFVYSAGRGWVELRHGGRTYSTRPLLLWRRNGMSPRSKKRWVADNLVALCSVTRVAIMQRTKPNTFTARFETNSRESGIEVHIWVEVLGNKATWSVDAGTRTGCIWRTVILLGTPAPLVLRKPQEVPHG